MTDGTPKGEHELREHLDVDIYYPDHPPRTESALYRETHHLMIYVEKRPCWVCGTLEHRETHHFHIEWADANGVDWDRMRKLHPDFNWSKFKEATDFVDSAYNMMVLCADHHRHRDRGIHMLPYPIWIMQAVCHSDFIFEPNRSLVP